MLPELLLLGSGTDVDVARKGGFDLVFTVAVPFMFNNSLEDVAMR